MINNVPLSQIPSGVMFRHVDFESSKDRIYIHYGTFHNGFTYDGESKYSYNFAQVGNLVGGKIVLFDADDIVYSTVSSHAKDCYMCRIIPA